MKFVITGYPRCRSAWLSAILTAHGSPCLHEPEVLRPGWRDLSEFAGFDGISDPSCTVLYPEQLTKHCYGRPCVYIKRDREEAISSLRAWSGLPVDNLDRYTTGLKWFVTHFKPMIVPYAMLDDPHWVEAIIQHVTAKPMNPAIFALFDKLDIQQSLPKARRACPTPPG